MAETFSPVRPRARWGIPSFDSASKTVGLVAPKAAVAAADFKNERRFIAAAFWFVGLYWIVSSNVICVVGARDLLTRNGVTLAEVLCPHGGRSPQSYAQGSHRWLKNLLRHALRELRSDRVPSPRSLRAWVHQFRKHSPWRGANPFVTTARGNRRAHNLPFRFAPA